MPDRLPVVFLTHAGGAHVDGYLQGLAASDACGPVILSDPDGNWADKARQILQNRLQSVVKSPAEALGQVPPGPSLALVSYEARLAPPIIQEALQAGCHVLAEKPGCVRVDEFRPLVQLADSRHQFLMLAFANRLKPEIEAARRLIAEGTLGRIFGIELHLVADQTRLTNPAYHRQWYASRERAGGGHLIWLGIHWLDLAMFVTGSKIVRVTGLTANVGGQPLDVEDSAVAALGFEAGFLGTLTSGYYLRSGYHSHLQIWGSEGWLKMDPVNEKQLRWSVHKGPRAGEIQELPPSTAPNSYTPLVQASVDAALRGDSPPLTSADSLRALETVFGVYRAMETGQTQTIG
jgi:predicted dehydrogenase